MRRLDTSSVAMPIATQKERELISISAQLLVDRRCEIASFTCAKLVQNAALGNFSVYLLPVGNYW
jgi:hypothetical protein